MAPKAKAVGSAENAEITARYKKHELRDHIYEIPDTYVGSMEPQTVEMYLIDDATKCMAKREVTYVPGLFKCFDEIIVNALDQSTRLKTDAENGSKEAIKHVKNIKVNIDRETGIVTIYNDGDGIDVENHPEHNMYVPELIFGNLLTSTNYSKDDRTVGGRNGAGIKLANIFATELVVETVDHRRARSYKQRWSKNMTVRDAPTVKAAKTAPYTRITWTPDYARFGMNGMTDDLFDLFRRRTMDAGACTDPTVSVWFNDVKVEYKDFEHYVDLFIGNKTERVRSYEVGGSDGRKWEIVATYSDGGQFEHVSFVNGIYTMRGGKHVDYVVGQITKKMVDMVQAKKKKEVKPQHIKDNLWVFVKATIVNPAFDSQTKETLTTIASKFGSKCELSDKFFAKLFASGIADRATALTDFHDNKKLVKTDGKKTSRIIVPKLDDANKAGTKDSAQCTLILTEGDSARSMAIAGLSEVGRDKYGVFPLRGKILNVKEAAAKAVADNAEITHLKKILGLEQNKDYKDVSSLRYGKVMIMTDQDSVTGDTPLLLRDAAGFIHIRTISDVANGEWVPSTNGKDYNGADFTVWTESGWTAIKHVMRHKVEKRIFRVVTHTGSVDVTEDHSLLTPAGEKITPNEVKVGHELLHSFPNFGGTEWRVSSMSEEDAYALGCSWDSGVGTLARTSVPTAILNASEDVKRRFIDGLHKSGANTCAIKGKLLAMGMYYLFSSIGYTVTMSVYETCTPDVYYLTALEENCGDYDNENEANPIAIKKIIDMGVTEDYVYDLETENHHFHAGVGQMIVHNTDGFHIRGLLFNVFQTLWPSLFKMEGFLTSMRTPIVKVTHPVQGTTSFYNLPDFHAWNAARTDGRWTIKYYKGLGTSTAIEAKEYFRSLNITEYKYDGEESEESMNLAFDKKRADDRKAWILGFDSRKTLDYTKPVTFSTFVNDELIHFSNRDVERNIPSLVDGMKESIRKIMFACFKKKLYSKEIRVAQLSGYVSEVAVYHHGEKSLQDAIVGMAQDFVGSNNINLLMPNGQFGTRIQGGDDAASPRYIHTMLSPLARLIFREEDNAVLTYKNDDDVSIEPTWYVPVIPMILVNGGLGIGTGFSTNVPCHNPSDIINMCATIIAMLDVAHGAEGADTNADNLESSYTIIDAAELEDIAPWYLGFVGKIELKQKKANTDETYVSRGCWAWKDDTTLEITELPVGVWTETYKEHLTKMIVDGSTLLKDFESHYTDKKACFTLKIFPGKREAVENVLCDVGSAGFKLEASKSLGVSNMHLFDAESAIHKYADTVEIVKAWARVRLATYQKRKMHQLRTMEAEYRKVSAKVRFINDFIKGTVVIMNRKEEDVDAQLERLEYPRLGSIAAEAAAEMDVEAEESVTAVAPSANYRYLTNLPIRQLTTEQKAKLESEAATLKDAIDALTNTPIHRIWRKELSELHVAWEAHRAAVEKSYSDAPDANASGASKKRRAAPKAAAARKK